MFGLLFPQVNEYNFYTHLYISKLKIKITWVSYLQETQQKIAKEHINGSVLLPRGSSVYDIINADDLKLNLLLEKNSIGELIVPHGMVPPQNGSQV